MWQRILKIFGIILLLASLSSAAGVYLLHHNRNQIVNYLTEELRQHSNIDITIAKTSVGFHQGLTFDMLDIHARSESGDFDLEAPRVHIRLELLSLLQGEIVSTEAELRNPKIVWHLTPNPDTRSSAADETSFTPPGKDWEINTDTLSFVLSTWRRIVCSDASIEIYPGEHAPLKFSHANLSLSQEGIGTPLLADLSGGMRTSVQDEPMRIHMKTRLSAPSAERSLPFTHIKTDTSINLRSINAAEANKYLPASWGEIELQGIVELDASLKGSLAQGLNFAGNIRSTSLNGRTDPLQINYNGSAAQPGETEFTGELTYRTDNGLKISSMDLESALAKARGDIRLTPQEQYADITFSSTPISYAQLHPWFKNLPAAWEERLHGGQITCEELHYSGSLNPPVATKIKSSSWIIELPALIPTEYAEDQSNTPKINLDQTGNTVEAKSSTLEWNGESFNANAALNLQGEWNAHDESFSASMDLSQSSVKGAGIDIKKPESPAQLRFKFLPRSQGWELADATLKTPEIDANLSAKADTGSDLRINLELNRFDLNSLRTRIPILDFMELGGKVDLNYSLKYQESSWSGSGTMTLHNCSIYPALLLGRIHHVNGQVNIDGLGINAPKLSLQLGEDASLMRASASIADLRQPVAEIHARGDDIIANDLIFNSRTALLHNLEGHLRIHAKGIDFVSARVDLEQGTHAEVQGTLGFSPPDLDLDIHATYADIDEIIALWQKDRKDVKGKDSSGQSSGHKIPATLPADEALFIDAKVERGIFSGFAFQNAEGRINIQKKQLRIEPLEFEADAGKGDGKIVLSTTAAPYLKVTGALEDIDADKVYTQLFEDLGLITGTLNGEFNLHGPIGHNFSANADGDFMIDVRDGVLRQFKFLSKAFSLLNVAQLFKMQLPDMSSEGMPFKRLSADLKMEDGVLNSNNLLIRGEAMNLALAGEFSIPHMQIDAAMALNPLGTVDSIFSKIPVAGWLLTGEKKTFVTVEFDISGSAREPVVSMKPLSSVSNKMFGILERAFTLPGTTLTDPGKVFFHQGKKEKTSEDKNAGQ